MDPVSISAAAGALIAEVDWKKIIKGLASDAASKGAKGLLEHFKADEREEAAQRAVQLFVEEFLAELEDKTPLSAAVPGYHDQLRRLIEHAVPDITSWLQPETKEVDLGSVERIWRGLKLDRLPEDFDWALVAKSYARDIRKLIKGDSTLRAQLNTALLEQQTELQQKSVDLLARMIGPDTGFDLIGYRDYLRKKCALLQLSAMHTSTYDRRVNLWSVFVAQSARESSPVRDLPRELLRRLRHEGHIKKEYAGEIERLREDYQSSPVRPVLNVLSDNRLVVVIGDPGSGKTSLLKFLVMRWATLDRPPLPVWIDLKEYAQDRRGFLKYCESGLTTYGLDSGELEKRLKEGVAALYLDGLDEIFDGPTRGSVVDEITAFASRYTRAPFVVTSRIVGYQADQLRNAGFTHATLEDFDDVQVSEFLRKWHDAAEDEATERTRLQGQLERALQESRAVRDLAGNPLLLTMMAILNRNQDLPRDRVELYAQASRVLLHEWDASRSLPVDTFARQEKEELLRALAGLMQQGDGGLAGNLIDRARLVDLFRAFLRNLGVPDPHGHATSLVKQLTERNFILCFAGADRFSFVHRTFLEYFCAAWFVDLFQRKQTLSLDQLKNDVFGAHWKDETWHEVLRLIAGMVGEKHAEELILFLMEQDGRHDKLANLMLAAGCLSEVRNRRAIQATDEALREKFVEKVIRYDPPYYFEAWEESSEVRPTREKAVKMVALVWRSEGTRVWLRSAMEAKIDWIVRRAALQELARGWKDDPETLPILKKCCSSDEDNEVRRAAFQEVARGWINDPKTLPWLKERVGIAERFSVRAAAVLELAWGWADDVDTLPLLKNLARSKSNFHLRDEVVAVLARVGKNDPETLSILREVALSDGNAPVRAAAVRELAGGWKGNVNNLRLLKEFACSDESYDVRMAVVQGVARYWKDDAETPSWLKGRAGSDESFHVRVAAVEELARGWKGNSAMLWLKERLRSDENDDVRSAAIQELARGWREDDETLTILKDRARSDESPFARLAAIQELARGWKDDPEIGAILKACACSDESFRVRRSAVEELAHGWRDDSETLAILKERASSDEHFVVRTAAVQRLARVWKDDAGTLAILKNCARSDENYSVRRAAFQELARGWREDTETLPILKARANSDDNEERRVALRELARGWKDDPEVMAMIKYSLRLI